jgi:hypothetical protein
MTFSTSVGRVSLFGEATLSYGSDKRFVAVDPGSGDLIEYRRADDWVSGKARDVVNAEGWARAPARPPRPAGR